MLHLKSQRALIIDIFDDLVIFFPVQPLKHLLTIVRTVGNRVQQTHLQESDSGVLGRYQKQEEEKKRRHTQKHGSSRYILFNWKYYSHWDENQRNRVIIFHRMYRKYTITGTHVLNSHHYLIAATQSDTREATLFHQVLIPSHLPILADPNKIQSIISDSENQNVINQEKNGFEVYFQQNLVQIRLKKGIILMSELKNLPFPDIMEAIGLLNLDFAMSYKQISANRRHNQQMTFNNSCKFYNFFLDYREKQEQVLPFLSLEEKQIHYYDLSYGGLLGQNPPKKKQSTKDPNKNQITVKNNYTYNEDQIFHRYIDWLVKVLVCPSVTQFKQDLESCSQPLASEEEESLAKLEQSFCSEIEKSLVGLFRRYFHKREEYTINIFKKQCQLIQERYSKIISTQHTIQNEKRVLNIINEKRSSFNQNQDLKTRLSKSFIDFNKTRADDKKPARRQSAGRLKYSKSEITLNKPRESGSCKPGRKLKKATLNIFKSSKIENKNTSSHFFGDSGSTHFYKTKVSPSDAFTKSFNFTKMSSAASNWFTQSMKESELNSKLRNFKKATINVTAMHTPKQVSREKYGSTEVINQNDQVGEESLNRFSKLYNNRSKAKGMIEIKNASPQQELQKNHPQVQQPKHQTIHVEEKILLDQFTMTQTPKPQQKHIKNVSEHKRSIINTLSLSVFDQKDNQSAVMEVKSPKKTQKHKKQSNKENNLQMERKQKEQDKKPRDNKKMNQPEIGKNANIFQNSQNIEEFEQVISKKIKKKQSTKNIPKPTEKTPEIQAKATKKQVPQPKLTHSSSQQSQTIPKKTKKATPILSETQKTLYLKHFQIILKFCNEHKTTITLLPNSNNLTFLINFLYYKTLLEHSNTENNSPYKKLVGLLEKKQQKFDLKEKQEYLMYRIDCDSLWNKSKSIRMLELQLTTKLESFIKGEEDVFCQDQFQDFFVLSEEAIILLSKQIEIFYKFLRSNKPMLINKGGFQVLLQLGYMMVVTSIMSHQRLKYYQHIEKHQFQEIAGSFSFLFQENAEQYVANYRQNLKQKQLMYLDVQEEFTSLNNWIAQFS